MSSIIADTIKGRSGKASDFPEGATVTGVVTATTFKGALTGNVTGDASGSSGSCTGNAATATLATNASGLTGTPSITVQDVTAEYVSIAGTLTYDDVINVDSVGIVTAGKGFRATAGGIHVLAGVSTFAGAIDANSTLDVDGDTQLDDLTVAGVATFSAGIDANSTLDVDGDTQLDDLNVSGVSTYSALVDVNNSIDVVGGANIDEINVAGVSTFVGLSTFADGLIVHSGAGLTVAGDANFTSALKESVTTSTNTVNVYNVDLINGNVHKFDTNGSGAGTVYITYNGGNNVNAWMATNDTVSVSVIAKPNSAGYINAMQIDGTGTGVTVEWSSDSAATPSSGNDGAYDLYAFNIVKTGSAAYLVFASRTKYD